MCLSIIEVINEFNNIKDKYRNLYFDVYTVLLMHDWRPLDDYIGYDNFDFLVSSDLYDRYMHNEDSEYAEIIESDFESFEVEIYNCKNIKPPEDYICSITEFSNIVIQDLLNGYSKKMSNYRLEVYQLFESNNWIYMYIDDVECYDGQYVFDFQVYVSPFLMSSVDEFNTIDRDNIKILLDKSPNLIIDTNLWWDYKIS